MEKKIIKKVALNKQYSHIKLIFRDIADLGTKDIQKKKKELNVSAAKYLF